MGLLSADNLPARNRGGRQRIPMVARNSWRWETTKSIATGALTMITAAARRFDERPQAAAGEDRVLATK